MIDHLSWSAVNQYLQNPAEYWFKYIRYPEDRAAYGAWHFTIGQIYHEAIESLYKGMNLDSVLELYDVAVAMFTSEYQQKDKANLRKAIENYYLTIIPGYLGLVETVEVDEKAFYIDGIDVPIHLRIDLQLIDDRIIDHKTVGRMEPSAVDNGQLNLYAFYRYKKTGRIPRQVELHKAFKESGEISVEVASTSYESMLNTVYTIKQVYEAIKNNVFYSTGVWFNEAYKNEWSNLIVKRYQDGF